MPVANQDFSNFSYPERVCNEKLSQRTLVQHGHAARFYYHNQQGESMPAGKRHTGRDGPYQCKEEVLLAKVLPFRIRGEIQALQSVTRRKKAA